MDSNNITYDGVKHLLCEQCKVNNKNTYRLMVLCKDCQNIIYSQKYTQKIDSIGTDTREVYKIESVCSGHWRKIDD